VGGRRTIEAVNQPTGVVLSIGPGDIIPTAPRPTYFSLQWLASLRFICREKHLARRTLSMLERLLRRDWLDSRSKERSNKP